MADVPIHSMTDIWNNVLTTFYGIKMDVTDTNSATASRLLALMVGGAERFAVTKAGAVLASDGTEPLPGFAFVSDPDTGFYRSAVDAMRFVTGGVTRFSVSSAGINAVFPFLAPTGAVGAPSITFGTDTDTGLYSGGANILNLSVGGTLRLSVSTAAIIPALVINGVDGTAALPALTGLDTDTGIFFPAVNNIAVATLGTERLRINGTGTMLYAQSATSTPGDGNTTIGAALTAESILYLSNNAGKGLHLNRNTSDGAVATFARQGVTGGSITIVTAGPTTTYNTTSDPRLKFDADAPDGWDVLERFDALASGLRWFGWNNAPDVIELGWYAPDYQKVLPRGVTGKPGEVDEKGNPVMQSIDKMTSIPLLTAALSGALRLIASLEARVAHLEGA